MNNKGLKHAFVCIFGGGLILMKAALHLRKKRDTSKMCGVLCEV